MIYTFGMDKVARQFEEDIMRMLGMSGRIVQKMVLTFEQGQLPTISTEEFLYSAPDVLVTKTYTVTEVN